MGTHLKCLSEVLLIHTHSICCHREIRIPALFGWRKYNIWPRGYKTFFMLNSAEHENFSVNKYENANFNMKMPTKVGIFILIAEKFPCSAIFSKKEFRIVSNLRFIKRTNFMLS